MSKIEFRSLECRVEAKPGPGIPIILLHGFSFTIDVWDRIGLIKLFKSKNIPYLAIDMPYGLKSDCSKKVREPDFNVEFIRYAFEKYGYESEPLIIGASLGGYVALKYALKYPVAGLILIAPVRTYQKEFRTLYEKDIPILVIYGTKDEIVSLDELQAFVKNIKSGELKIYENARHPAYLDYPDQFRNDVYLFYKGIGKS